MKLHINRAKLAAKAKKNILSFEFEIEFKLEIEREGEREEITAVH